MMSDLPTLTRDEVARLLRVSPETVRQLAANGEHPGRKIGRAWRFPRAGIETFALETHELIRRDPIPMEETMQVCPTCQD